MGNTEATFSQTVVQKMGQIGLNATLYYVSALGELLGF